MTETRTEYDTEKQKDRLAEIEAALKPIGKAGWEYDRGNPVADIAYLVGMVKLLRLQVEQLADALEVVTQ